MAVTVTTDFSQIASGDSVTSWTSFGGLSMDAVETVSQVQGSGCIEARWNITPSLGGMTYDIGTATSWENRHVYFWIRASFPVDTFANGGVRLRFGPATNYGEWDVGGSDKGIRAYKGWYNAAVDVHKPYDRTSGTVPTYTSEDEITGVIVPLAGSGKDAPVADEIKYGSKIIIGGGTTGDRGTFDEIGSDDLTNGRGLVKKAGGVFFSNVHLEFGNSSVTASWFDDSNQVLVFEDLKMSATLYKVSFVGNAISSDNRVFWGDITGSGTTEEGASGNVVTSAGDIPFRIEGIDSNVNQIDIGGSIFTGPTTLYDDALRNFKVEDNGTGFTDDTFDANDSGASDAPCFPTTQAANDACYWGHNERFYELNINLGTAKTGTWTVTWEYYNGSSWSSLTDVTDGTSDFSTTGSQTVTYSIPDDWTSNAVDSDTRYWVRARISSFTSSGTTPSITQTTTAMAGDIRLEDSAVKFVGCTFTNMGSIRIRNGAYLKKSLITDSVVPAKHAAIDFGGSDPTANTVRDLTIQNCSKGILLKGSGDTTYNFRNIQFAGNTNDVRVDFGGSDTITINILESGDTPSIDNVNSSTVNIVNSVTLEVNGVIQNTQCYIVPSAGGASIMNESASELVSGDEYKATESYSYASDTDVVVRTRELGYLPFETSGTITNTGLTVTAVWLVDPNFKRTVTDTNITFTNATSLITRASGNFTTDGWIAIMSQVTVEGSANNDGTYELSATGTTTVTITGATLTDEGPISGVSLTFTRRSPTW